MPAPMTVLRSAGLAALLSLAASTIAHAQSGFFGNWFYHDGSQAFNSRAVAGAAPNALATGRGVRCEYRYIVRNGQRIRYQYCE